MLAFAGTLAIHTLLFIAADAIVVIYPPEIAEIAPRIEMIEVEVPKEPPPPPPPPPAEEAAPDEPPPAPDTPPPPPRAQPQPQVRRAAQPRTTEPPPAAPSRPARRSDPGGAPVVSMDDIAPAATGVAVAVGRPNTGRVGRGGTGGGTGTGAGTGSGGEPAPPAPVSVATIKTRALPKGDYGYFGAGKDCPAGARQLGLEGVRRVRLVVDDTGKVRSAVLLNKLGHGLDELALTRAKQIEFEPAKDTDDKPVSSVVVWTFNMTLPK